MFFLATADFSYDNSSGWDFPQYHVLTGEHLKKDVVTCNAAWCQQHFVPPSLRQVVWLLWKTAHPYGSSPRCFLGVETWNRWSMVFYLVPRQRSWLFLGSSPWISWLRCIRSERLHLWGRWQLNAIPFWKLTVEPQNNKETHILNVGNSTFGMPRWGSLDVPPTYPKKGAARANIDEPEHRTGGPGVASGVSWSVKTEIPIVPNAIIR